MPYFIYKDAVYFWKDEYPPEDADLLYGSFSTFEQAKQKLLDDVNGDIRRANAKANEANEEVHKELIRRYEILKQMEPKEFI